MRLVGICVLKDLIICSSCIFYLSYLTGIHLLSSAEANRVDYASISDEEWKGRLTGEQYYITRQKGTERAFTGYDVLCYCKPFTLLLPVVGRCQFACAFCDSLVGHWPAFYFCPSKALLRIGSDHRIFTVGFLDIAFAILILIKGPAGSHRQHRVLFLLTTDVQYNMLYLFFFREYWNTKTPGTYHCICCDTPLFE